MPYIGNIPADKFLTLAKQNFSTSATTSYTLDNSISSTQDIALFINNVRQSPVDAYSVSGTALTLTSATAGTDEMYCVYLGKTVGTVSPASDSVTTAMIQSNAVNNSKMADDAIGLAELSATGTPSSSNFLRGDNSWATAGGNNTPSFYVYIDSNLSVSHNTQTLIPYNQEIYDIGGCFNNTGSNATLNGLTCPPNGFCPNEAGYYYFNAQTHYSNLTASQMIAGEQEVIQMYTWFSSVGTGEEITYKYHFLPQYTENTNMIFYFNGTGNCMQIRAYQANNTSTTKTVRGGGNPMTNAYTTYLHGFKLIT